VLDFAYAAGLRVSELVGACLGNIATDARGDHWVSVIGKGRRAGKVALPRIPTLVRLTVRVLPRFDMGCVRFEGPSLDDEKEPYGAPVGLAQDRYGRLVIADDLGNTIGRVKKNGRPGRRDTPACGVSLLGASPARPIICARMPAHGMLFSVR
jgi:integrase